MSNSTPSHTRHQTLRLWHNPGRRGARCFALGRTGRDRFDHGTVRVRQDHAAFDARRAAQANRRDDSTERHVISALAENRLPDIRLRRFGFIFQDFNLLSALTALENVAIVAELAGLRNGAARKKAAALLTDLGLGGRLNFLPEKLSGGEKQRVAVARALVNDPALILADEPTANLDSKIGHEIMCLLRQIAKEHGRSVVIVSHDQRIKDIADRVLWLEDGQFKEMVSMATDPVCGMTVEREKAAALLEFEGTAYYFCARGRRDEFAPAQEQDRKK